MQRFLKQRPEEWSSMPSGIMNTTRFPFGIKPLGWAYFYFWVRYRNKEGHGLLSGRPLLVFLNLETKMNYARRSNSCVE